MWLVIPAVTPLHCLRLWPVSGSWHCHEAMSLVMWHSSAEVVRTSKSLKLTIPLPPWHWHSVMLDSTTTHFCVTFKPIHMHRVYVVHLHSVIRSTGKQMRHVNILWRCIPSYSHTTSLQVPQSAEIEVAVHIRSVRYSLYHQFPHKRDFLVSHIYDGLPTASLQNCASIQGKRSIPYQSLFTDSAFDCSIAIDIDLNLSLPYTQRPYILRSASEQRVLHGPDVSQYYRARHLVLSHPWMTVGPLDRVVYAILVGFSPVTSKRAKTSWGAAEYFFLVSTR